MAREAAGPQRTLTDKTVRNVLGPLRARLATAKREGDIPDNPAVGAALPHRPAIEEESSKPRPFPKVDGHETMEMVVQLVHPDHRLMFEVLAATGLRRSELLALGPPPRPRRGEGSCEAAHAGAEGARSGDRSAEVGVRPTGPADPRRPSGPAFPACCR